MKNIFTPTEAEEYFRSWSTGADSRVNCVRAVEIHEEFTTLEEAEAFFKADTAELSLADSPETPKQGYLSLSHTLKRALNQAQNGKGKERHANGKSFEQQPIMAIQEMVGAGFCLGQAIKKIQESVNLDTPKASTELLGAINYLAAAILFQEREYVEEKKNE